MNTSNSSLEQKIKLILGELYRSAYDLPISKRLELTETIDSISSYFRDVAVVKVTDGPATENEPNVIYFDKQSESLKYDNSNLVKSKQFDAVIAQDGSGDYTDIATAWKDGHRALLFREGTYEINEPLLYLEYDKPIAFVAEKPQTVKIIANNQIHLIQVAKKFDGVISNGVSDSNDQNIHTITGTGTKFTTDFRVGDVFWFASCNAGNNNELLEAKVLITQINSDTELVGQVVDGWFNTNYATCIFNYPYWLKHQDVTGYIAPTFTTLTGSISDPYYLYATDGNFTQSVKAGDCLMQSQGTWAKQHFVIDEVIDDNTLRVRHPLMMNVNLFNNEVSLYHSNATKPFIFDGIEFVANASNFIRFGEYGVFVSQVIMNNCITYNRAFVFDGIGYNWIITNCVLNSDIYAPFGSIVMNCKGPGVYYNYTPFCSYISCQITQQNWLPNSWGVDGGGYGCSYIACSFPTDLPTDYIPSEDISVIGCLFNNKSFTQSSSILTPTEIRFPDGVLKSSENGLIYNDNSQPLVNIYNESKIYTFVLNGPVTTGSKLDGVRTVPFNARVRRISITAETNSNLTLSVECSNYHLGWISNITTTNLQYDFYPNLQHDYNIISENDRIWINITNAVNVSNLTVEVEVVPQ